MAATLETATLKTPHVIKLSDPPAGDYWTPAQWDVLVSLLDAVLAPVVAESELEDRASQIKLADAQYEAVVSKNAGPDNGVAGAPDRDLLRAVLAERFSADPARVTHLRRTVSTTVHPRLRDRLGSVLSLASSRWGAFLLTGYCTPVQLQPVHVREAILRGWAGSRIPSLRLLPKSFASLAALAWLHTSPLFKQVSGYLDVPHGWRAGPGFEFEFLQFQPRAARDDDADEGEDETAITVDTDVVIVGSGCGGGVCAKSLAEAGHRVLVLDKGYHFPPSQLPMPQEEGSRLLYENGGVVASMDGSVNLVAGSCWGGGGTVNWSVSLQTQDYVRRGWSREAGLPFFETQEFQDCLDRVCNFMGATPGSEAGVEQSHRGRVLLDGCRRLGWQAAPAPQNSGGGEHHCGRCHLGCSSSEKQGPAVSWLPAAARAGATFIEGFKVEKVVFDESSSSSPGTNNKAATGVVGTWTSRDRDGSVTGPKEQRVVRKVVVKAKKVILSAGSLWSPVILLRSGLKNRHIGHHLYLHPCNYVGAYYKEDIRPWEGGIITSYCNSFENLDGQGHGVKLEPTCQVPYTTLAVLPWHSSLDFKLAAVRYRHMDAYISLARDRDAGRVEPDRESGEPVVHYTPSGFDRAHVLEGVIAIAKFCHVMGAEEIRAFLPGTEPFVRRGGGDRSRRTSPEDHGFVAVEKTDTPPSTSPLSPSSSPSSPSSPPAPGPDDPTVSDPAVSDPAFASWVESVRRVGNSPPLAPFMSAHQMGTCRMSAGEDGGVVDGHGRVWGADNLFVADASVFPSASGVNPMVTNMAIADWVAGCVGRELAAKRTGRGGGVI